MKSRGTLAVVIGLALGLAFAPFGLAEETPASVEQQPTQVEQQPAPVEKTPAQVDAEARKSSSRPPRNLKKMPDGHWTPWDPPAVVEGEHPHVIIRGDTLWDLSATNLNNPYLWPQIWDRNRYVLDSHWIYPGDPIVLPVPEVVPEAPAGGPAADADLGEEEEEVEPAPPVEYPIGDKQDIYCSATLRPEAIESEPRIVAAEDEELVGISEGNIVYINAGSSAGYKPGDRFSVLRDAGHVRHPVTREDLGHRIDSLGWVTLIAVQEKGSTGEVRFSCEDMHKGDVLVPFLEITVPTETNPRSGSKIDRYNPVSSGKAKGYLVLSRDPQDALGRGNIINVDLGATDGINPGDILTIFRPNPSGEDLPRVNLGEGIVLMSAPDSSVVRITASVREIYLGDRVELQ